MSRLNWAAPEGRFFDTGLDRGVLYPKGTPPIGSIVATNYILNPSFEVSTLHWAAAVTGVTVSRDTTQFDTGVASLKFVTDGASGAQGVYYTPFTVPELPVGSYFSGRVRVKAPLGWQGEVVLISLPDTSTPNKYINFTGTGSWQTVVALGAVLQSGQSPYVVVRSQAGNTTPATVYIDSAAIFAGSKEIPYFDGNSESGAYTFAWTGTPGLSTSTKREILTYAVPWMGLQGVDEEGGESAAAYYIDGRPFLFLPRPKEFKATLKAITYPDAFSQIMGVQEVADGMYLDSQPGDSFDLSYRTLVGNATSGVDHGYKIHLVYNCSVAPQALAYESLSDAINPTSFSWEIQAVPVPVEGFRPTAHIIIDTRHMDQKKIDAVEELLYGSEDEVASMPTPQAIFDLLSFGDTIVVTDNGDGTFDVVGSYENVYMVGDGIFRVDNVDGTDNGDGTFTISTTLE